MSALELAKAILDVNGIESRLPSQVQIVETWREALHDHPGALAPVVDLPGTLEALVRLHPNLERVGPLGREALAESSAVRASIVDVFEIVQERLEGFVGTRMVYSKAAELVRSGQDISGFGPIIVVDTGEISDVEESFLDAVGPTATFSVDTTAPTMPSKVVSASDSDDEARFVVRQVMSLLASGTPAHEIAVLYPLGSAYAGILEDYFSRAGIASYGPDSDALIGAATAVSILMPLSFTPGQISRTELFDWLEAYPLGVKVPVRKWEKLALSAGVAHGSWNRPLYAYGKRTPSKSDSAEALRVFVADLSSTLSLGRSLRGRRAVSQWFLDFLGFYYSNSNILDPKRKSAYELIVRTTKDLIQMEDYPNFSLSDLRGVLTFVLSSQFSPRGAGFVGVYLGPLSNAAAVNAEHLFLMGLSEDLCPGPLRGDPLMPDSVLGEVFGFATVSDKVQEIESAVLRGLTCSRVTTSFSRGDLRSSTERNPSRFLLEVFEKATGTQFSTQNWKQVTDFGVDVTVVPSSWYQAISALPFDDSGVRLQRAICGQEIADEVCQRGVRMLTGREGEGFCEFEGNLTNSTEHLRFRGTDKVLSASALEQYVCDPLSFFIERILSAPATEDPEVHASITPKDLGSLIHETFDRLVQSREALPDFGMPFSLEDREDISRIFTQTASEFYDRGQTGLAAFWDVDSRHARQMLMQMMAGDDSSRISRGTRIVGSERTFGKDDPVIIDQVRFVGMVDRVEEDADGVVHVVDFKTGASTSYRGIKDSAKFGDGSRFQLPLYAYAMGGAGFSQYLFKDGKTIGIQVDRDVLEELERRVGKIIDDIEAGRFFPEDVPHR